MGCSQFARMIKRAIDSSLVCVSLTMTTCVVSAQERVGDESHGIIENLMRRSAEERWQSMKRRYPLDSSVGTVRDASKSAGESSNAEFNNLIPPAPSESTLIPRSASIPARNPDDWILPARPLNSDELSLDPSSTDSKDDKQNLDEVSSSRSSNRTARRVAAVDIEKTDADDDKPKTEQHLVRKMGEIAPFYDRDNDDDIRDFAVEKAKDYGIDIDRPRPYHDRLFPQMVVPWEPSNMYYHPLYFADPALERYGHSHHPLVQPFASIARFGTQFCFMPYQLTIDPPCVEVSPLGWYRPGDCAPKLHYQVPLNAEAAAVQAGYVAGLYFLIP